MFRALFIVLLAFHVVLDHLVTVVSQGALHAHVAEVERIANRRFGIGKHPVLALGDLPNDLFLVFFGQRAPPSRVGPSQIDSRGLTDS